MAHIQRVAQIMRISSKCVRESHSVVRLAVASTRTNSGYRKEVSRCGPLEKPSLIFENHRSYDP
ncbi:hypothetical protein AKJ09_08961 [Labilithrix luteola]|uniref:Uncharacterized protein n=1 Tax=Labilithrix luteola TaxID=1391654 RepID=A0A0K1Q989_9BACT|nr:hypothetical protein AKJ09_08961 [Labilithrix luteola]